MPRMRITFSRLFIYSFGAWNLRCHSLKTGLVSKLPIYSEFLEGFVIIHIRNSTKGSIVLVEIIACLLSL